VVCLDAHVCCQLIDAPRGEVAPLIVYNIVLNIANMWIPHLPQTPPLESDVDCFMDRPSHYA
jgi:hypothetical protein